jgi:hypothetical protein
MFTTSVISGNCKLDNSLDLNSGIKVTATGPYGKISVQTEEDGQYKFTGLGEGTYTLNFGKEGYGDVKMYSIKLFGNDTVYAPYVYLFEKFDLPMPEISRVSIQSNPRFGQDPVVVLETSLTIQDVLPAPPIILYTDSIVSVSYKSYTQLYPYVYSVTSERGQGKIDYIVQLTELFPFRKGTLVYFQAYVANPEEIFYGYFDNYLGIQQFSTLMIDRHSEVLSFVMP